MSDSRASPVEGNEARRDLVHRSGHALKVRSGPLAPATVAERNENAGQLGTKERDFSHPERSDASHSADELDL